MCRSERSLSASMTMCAESVHIFTTGQAVLVSTLLARRRTKRLASRWHTLKACSNFASAEPTGDNADVGLWPLADLRASTLDVCFQGQSGLGANAQRCPSLT